MLAPEDWPYGQTAVRLVLALAIGLFIGIERERRGKEAGLRTFAFTALLGAVGGLLGGAYGELSLGLTAVLVILLNVETIRSGEGAEITTSAALLLSTFAGILAGQGHTFTPTLIGVATAALLAWKQPLAGFSHAVTESELRSAVLLAILAFVIFPVLPNDPVDPWRLISPRDAWVTILLIAALGFLNYVLLRLFGARALEWTGFLGGLVNSTITVTDLVTRVEPESDPPLVTIVYRATLLATAAMVLRNALILGAFAPGALTHVALAFIGMTAAALMPVVTAHQRSAHTSTTSVTAPALPGMASPLSLTATLRFGTVFVALQIGGTVATRVFGEIGFYAVSLIGGAVSSASAVASAASLAASGSLTPTVAGTGAALASLVSAFISVPVVKRWGQNQDLTSRVTWAVVRIVMLGVAGAMLQALFN